MFKDPRNSRGGFVIASFNSKQKICLKKCREIMFDLELCSQNKCL